MNAKTANDLDLEVMEVVHDLDINPYIDHFELFGDGQKLEVFNQADHQQLYYQWLSALMKVVKPKQVVELGSAAGISTIMMALFMPKDSKLYSVDIDPNIAWKWMKFDYPQVIKILSDDLDMNIWKDIDLEKTDILFIDALHTKEHLQKELDLYLPKLKNGTIVILDDIRMEGLWDIWQALPYDKCENTNPCHSTGYGFFIYDKSRN